MAYRGQLEIMLCIPDYRPLPRGIRNITRKGAKSSMSAFVSVQARNIKLTVLNDRFAKVEETRVDIAVPS